MKKFLVSLAIASTALTAAAPAAAQWQGRDRYEDRYHDQRGWDDRDYRGGDVRPQLHRLSQQISRGVERGQLTNGEARRLRAEVQQLWRLASRFHATGGYDRREQFELQRRIGWVREQLRFERRDDDRRGGWRY